MMVEINAKSLFGKHTYANEQLHIYNFANNVGQAIAYVEPLSSPTSMEFVLINKVIPREKKVSKIREKLTKARDILIGIGV
jgi:hypothetical protein